MRSEIATAAGFQALSLHTSCLPTDDRAYRTRVAPRSHELQPKPVITVSTLVSKKQRRFAVVDDENIQIAVVVVIAHSEAARRESFAEDRAGIRAHVLVLAIYVFKHQQRLFVFHS